MSGLTELQVQGHLAEQVNAVAATAAGLNQTRFFKRLERVARSENLDLPPFPDIARELDELLSQPTTDIIKIAQVVERDPGLVKRVWGQASGAMYAMKPRSLHHAVARVGLDALWRIGMSVCVSNNVFRVEGFQHAADRVRIHGIITAEVAAMLGGEKRGTVYMAGLLHDVGKLIIYRTAGSLGADTPPLDVVERLATTTHSAFGVLAARSWRLDDVAVGAIGYHHDPESAPPEYQRCARLVYAATVASHAAEAARMGQAIAGADPARIIGDMGFDALKALKRAAEVYAQVTEKSDGDAPM